MKIKEIINLLGVPENIVKMTEPVKKDKVFTSVKDNIPLIEDYNYMADLLMLPEDKHKFKYLFVMVDLATDEFDIEPIKNKTPKEVLKAMQTIFTRDYLKQPKSSIATDGGTEYKDEFDKWLKKNKIYHKIALAYRHSQMSNVEALNRQLGYLFNLYMNKKEQETGKVYREWTEAVDVVREALNKARKKPSQSISKHNYPLINVDAVPKFKVGDVVYYKSEVPLNALGHKQSTNSFRVGDFRYNVAPKKIKFVIPYAGNVPFRYVLDGLPNVSYTENQLLLSEEKETKYVVEKIIGKKKIRGKVMYLVKWKGYKVDESTYESRESLIEDGLEDYIKEYENKN